MSDLLREMCVEYESGAHRSNEEAMRAALLWLADNVSDEMALAAGKCRHGSNAGFEQEVIGSYRLAIAAALRAAAGSALEAKP